MKKIFLFLTLAALFSSCAVGIKGNGKVERESRDISNFQSIDVSGNFDVFIRQGDVESVKVEADDNLLELINTTVQGGELKISSTKSIRTFEKLSVYVTVVELKEIDGSGACDIKSEGTLKLKYLEIDISGACDIILDIECEGLDVEASGACDLDLKGVAEVASYDASGACDINAFGLKTKRCKIDMSGAGEANVTVKKKLEVNASGAGTVRYKGEPEDVDSKTSGAASVKAYN